MANTTVLDVRRPDSYSLRRTGEEAYVNEQADVLVATIDHAGDGKRIYQVSLPFSEFSGLREEWEEGTATVVLKQAIVSRLLDPGPPPDHLTITQRSEIVGYEIAAE